MNDLWIAGAGFLLVLAALALIDSTPEGRARNAQRDARRAELAAKVCEAHGGFKSTTGTIKTGRGWRCNDGTRFEHSDY